VVYWALLVLWLLSLGVVVVRICEMFWGPFASAAWAGVTPYLVLRYSISGAFFLLSLWARCSLGGLFFCSGGELVIASGWFTSSLVEGSATRRGIPSGVTLVIEFYGVRAAWCGPVS